MVGPFLVPVVLLGGPGGVGGDAHVVALALAGVEVEVVGGVALKVQHVDLQFMQDWLSRFESHLFYEIGLVGSKSFQKITVWVLFLVILGKLDCN